MPTTGSGNPTLSPREIRRLRRWIQFPTSRRGFRKVFLVDSPFEDFFRKNRRFRWKLRKRRRGKGSREYSTLFSRYREKDLASPSLLNKKRDKKITASTVLGHLSQWIGGVKVAGLGGNVTAGGDLKASLHLQRTWDQLNPGPPYGSGGPFKSIIYHLPSSSIQGYGRYTTQGSPGFPSGNFDVYEGGFVDNGFWLGPSYDSIAATGLSNFGSLSSYHTLAWDKLKPTIQKASLAQFIYELKDLPGQLETSANAFHRQWLSLGTASEFNPLARTVLDRGQFGALRRFRQVSVPFMQPDEVADHFLNHSFGWVPFISDVQKLFNAFAMSQKYIEQLVRDNGFWIRRRRVLDESDVTSADTISGVDSGTAPSSELRGPSGLSMCRTVTLGGFAQKGHCIFTTRTQKLVWACGQFKYYRPEFDPNLLDGNNLEIMSLAQMYLQLLGARITPTLLYKITPWTWLGDWFSNLGSHIERLDDFVQDGITARGLYVMETEQKLMTKTCTLNFWSSPVTLQFQRDLTLKQREIADSPYGFNVPWNNLSLRQWAILGAIGISRSNHGYISKGA